MTKSRKVVERLPRIRMDMAKRQAELLLEELGMAELPVALEAIARARGIEVMPYAEAQVGVSAMLLRYGNEFGILYSTRLGNLGFQRFSIAHELGHYFLEGHLDQIVFDVDGAHASRAGYFSQDPYEQEADGFASGLLMPTSLFRRGIGRFEDGLAAVKGLAALCQTSLTATAIRYAELTEAATAIVVSTGSNIDYCFMSKAMKPLAGHLWLRRGDPLPRGTLTANFNAQRDRYTEAEQIDEVDARTWLNCDRRFDAIEEIVGLGGYGKTLTLITCPGVDEEPDDQEDDGFDRRWPFQFPPRR